MSKKPADQAEQQEQAKEELAEEQVQEQQEAEKAADLPEDEEKVPVTEEEAERAHEPEQEDSEHRDDENDGLAGLDEDELPEDVAPLPVEVKKSLEAEYPVLQEHGSHNAAMKGLQTDASGSYDRSKL